VSKSNNDKSLACIFCDKPHKSSECYTAQKMPLDEKNIIVKDNKCCFCCLQPGHGIKSCKNNLKCPLCKKRHVLIMCPNFHSNNRPNLTNHDKSSTDVLKPETKATCSQAEDNVLSNSPISNRPNPRVFMQTLTANLRNPNNNTIVPVRLLFDTGSERSYIVQNVASLMKYEPLGQESLVHSLFGNIKTAENIHQKYRAYLTSKDNSYKCNFEVLSQPKICSEITHVTPGPWLKELARKNIYLTDTNASSLPISILVGADIAGKLFTGEREQLESGLVAMNTLLGWTLMGKVPIASYRDSCLSSVVTNMFIKDANIEDLWGLDLIGIKEPPEHNSKKENDLHVKKHFLETTIINQEERYEVKLPWVDSHPPLPNNKRLAEKRLVSVSNKLKTKNCLFTDYDAVFRDWLDQDIIEVVPSNELDNECHYLPHRPVVKESSATTRIRPVFDASAREQHTPSLNDCLECGPNLIELIPTVMLRFREGRYGVIADIAKAFLQIAVNAKDADMLRFLWYNSECDEITVFRHKRVVFGVKCSPFLLGAVIDLHLQRASENTNVDPNIIKKLQKSFYVDNVSASVDTLQELDKFIKDSTEIMKEGKFDLRGWQASSYSQEKCKPLDIVSVLGINWDSMNDVLFVRLDCLNDFDRNHITKREILSVSHRIFDPIGFICPVMLYPKLLLQKLWNQKIDWDTKVDSKTSENFLMWFDGLSVLQEIKVPRWIGKTYDSKGCTIHTFSDGSKDAYGAVIFMRVEKQGEV
jgi:hypothetical protein